jgi:hypothetical protein
MRSPLLATLLAVACGALFACSSVDTESRPPTPTAPHPWLLFQPAHLSVLKERVGREPWDTLWMRVEQTAAEPRAEPPPGAWDSSTWNRNGSIAEANALLAWVRGDEAAARRAKELLLSLDPEFSSNLDFDVNIRMAGVLIPFVNAWDWLSATPWLSAEESAEGRRRILSVTRQFASRYLDQPVFRTTALVITQNNHPLRTAAAIGYVALAFPDDPEAPRWRDWAVDTMDYLLGPKGHYVADDGAVVEGPFYHAFGFGGYLPFLIALEHRVPDGTTMRHVCLARNDEDPWTDHGCVEGREYTFTNPLHGDRLRASLDWSLALRRPNGARAHLADAKWRTLTGSAVVTGWGAPAYHLWDWKENPSFPLATNELTALHLGYAKDEVGAPPPWQNRFFPSGGHASFRSGWGESDVWALLVAESGPARKSLHNHADGTSFALSAYGEDLLIDPGYYKPDERQNPLTMDAPSHNVLLVDGAGAPKRGLLTAWGDTDAFLENTRDGEKIAWAEARMAYQGIELRRGMAFVRRRYFVIADRVVDGSGTARTFRWRAHLWAGMEAGGAYAIDGNRVKVHRAKAGLEIAATTTAGDPIWQEPPFAALKPPHVHQLRESESTAGNHAVVDATLSAKAPQYLVVLAPYAAGGQGDAAPLAVTAAGGGLAAWTIAGSGWKDAAWMRDAASPELATVDGHAIETDAAFACFSLDGEWALVAGGSKLVVDGRTIVAGNTAPVALVE